MRLEGSCQCGAVRFSVESRTYHPYMRCYCSICRKSSGGGGYAINLGADNRTLNVEGRENVTHYNARMNGSTSQANRHFCRQCGSPLWLWDPRWPELVHPLASAIDTELPVPPQTVHIMLASKPSWVTPDVAPGDLTFDEYPEESIEAWHRRHGLLDD
jgi:hypothetical protein